ncbi:capsular polysaccharide biosynthesis protein Cap8F [Clostridia bacterium]|nr:capsular polysaccharide biosynthesis protein Cap8F [Clostridia bacterium]
MNILITGANGFVGRNLIVTLEAIRDGKVNTQKISSANEIRIYLYDVENTQTDLDSYCMDCDFVFNFAGVNRPISASDFFAGNCGFTTTLLDTLRKYNNRCPIMIASSIQASLSGRFKDSEYGKSKKACEDISLEYARETGAKVLVYRFPNIFGKWCRPNYNSAIATFCYNTTHNLPIQVNDPAVEMDIVYIDDLIDEMIRALNGCETQEGAFCRVPLHYETTLGFIADTVKGFDDVRKSLGVPNFTDPLVSKLYSTWLSYLPPDKVVYDLHMNCDHRGSFTEIIRTPDRGQFSINISSPGITKGNHWHQSKNEKFIVVKGDALIQMRKIGSDEVMDYYVNGEKLQVVEMIPGYTHSINNLSSSEDLVTLMWANECFSPQKPDTFFEVVC